MQSRLLFYKLNRIVRALVLGTTVILIASSLGCTSDPGDGDGGTEDVVDDDTLQRDDGGEDTEDTADPVDTTDTADTVDTTEPVDAEDTADASDTTEPTDTSDTTDTTEPQDTSDAEDTADTTEPQDTSDAEDTADTTEPQDTSDTADVADTEDAEDTEDTEDAADTEDTEDAEDTQDTFVCPDNDNDGYFDAACGGDDCDDSDDAVNPGASEDCANSIDDDCDGDVDNADTECVTAEVCDNGSDDDLDGDIDCRDPDCDSASACVGDSCSDVYALAGTGSHSLNTDTFTDADSGSCGGAGGHDAVFELQVSQQSDIHIDTDGSNYETVLYVREGSCQTGLESVCESTVNPLVDWSRIEMWGAQPGTYYVFADAAQSLGSGDLTLNVVVTPTSTTPRVSVHDDPLVHMPGTQPEDGVTLEGPGRCLNCHDNYDPSVAPGGHWKGSMMAQSARDPIFFAAMTVAAQDSEWALGTPNAADLCERCHFPEGWLAGRSEPPNASRMTGSDFDGVHCDVCHQMYNPFFEDTFSGLREGSDWTGYWDETDQSTTPSSAAAMTTYLEDEQLSSLVKYFNSNQFYDATNHPKETGYDENAGGQYYVSPNGQKRGPYADHSARHSALYSRYTKSKYFCGTCHDVSNPALANLSYAGTAPGDGTTVLPSEKDSAHSYFHVERTFSEFMLSDYAQPGGAPGTGAYAPSSFDTDKPNNYIASCQDCHMPNAVGKAADKTDALLRPTNSVEHPKTGVGKHTLTGGNAFVPRLLASTQTNSPNYDATNAQLLKQGPSVLTLDLTQGLGLDAQALLDGAARAEQNLRNAATIENVTYDASTGELDFRIRNHTGHKLISGFPEGRRMFVNIRAYDGGGRLMWEVNPYDPTVGTLKGLDASYSPNSPSLAQTEEYRDELVYEMNPSSTLTGEVKTFHFVLADGRYKDNRIPPKGFRIADAPSRKSEPVWQGSSAPAYYTAAEYAGGYDDVTVNIVAGAASVDIQLFYQTTSREYMEFLRDQINGDGTTLSSPTLAGAANAYVIQDDAFYSALKAWGDVIWQLWDRNKTMPGAAPVLMTSATTP